MTCRRRLPMLLHEELDQQIAARSLTPLGRRTPDFPSLLGGQSLLRQCGLPGPPKGLFHLPLFPDGNGAAQKSGHMCNGALQLWFEGEPVPPLPPDAEAEMSCHFRVRIETAGDLLRFPKLRDGLFIALLAAKNRADPGQALCFDLPVSTHLREIRGLPK